MFPQIANRVIVYDTETPNLDWHRGTTPFGVSMTIGDSSYYWDLRKQPKAVQWLKDELPKASLIIAHRAQFDAHVTHNLGVRNIDPLFDCTMIRAALIDEHLFEYGLDYLGEKYCGVGKDEAIWTDLAELFGGKATKAAQIGNLPRAPVYLVERYAKQDTRTTWLLWQAQNQLIAAEGLEKICEFERKLFPYIVRMERGGVPVDIEAAERAVESITKEVNDKQRKLNNEAGFEVNFNPSGSIAKLFDPKQNDKGDWVLVDGTIADKTEGGKASINADVLRKMRHPCAADILRLRKLSRARDVFLRKHVLGHQYNGRVYPSINQTKNDTEDGTGTGRLSYTDPALQQMSSRDKEMAAIVRAIFVPNEGQRWFKMDWSQMDFRMFAHYLNDENILKKYQDDPDTDFHQAAADITGLPRSPRFAGDANSKQLNLGMVFGMGKGKLAWEMGLPYTVENRKGREFFIAGPEAESVFERYHGAIPGIGDLTKSASNTAKGRGYVRTMMDRHVHFPGGQFVHKAAGLIFQGTAADAMKQKLIEVSQYLEDKDSNLLLSVHDELGISMDDDPKMKQELTELYCRFDGIITPMKFRVPIRCESGIGDNWYEAGL